MTDFLTLELTDADRAALRGARAAELVFSGIDQDGPSYAADVAVDGVRAGRFSVYAFGGTGPRADPGIEKRLAVDPALLLSATTPLSVTVEARVEGGSPPLAPLARGVRLVVR